jgi:hypothetical protein
VLTVEPATVARREDDAWLGRFAIHPIRGNGVRDDAASDIETPVVVVVCIGHRCAIVKCRDNSESSVKEREDMEGRASTALHIAC